MYTNTDFMIDLISIFFEWVMIISLAYLVVITTRYIADYFEHN